MRKLLSTFLRYLPLTFGALGLATFGTFALLNVGGGNIRLAFLVGLVVSSILAMSNLWTSNSPRARVRYFAVLLAVYFLGIMVMGLREWGHWLPARYTTRELLSTDVASWYDLTVNVIGFIPLGFRATVVAEEQSWFRSRAGRIVWPALACALVSLGIELAQFFVRGRSSSLVDVATNAGGALLGVVYGLVFVSLWRSRDSELSSA